MICQLFAAVPGQGFIKILWQPLGLFDQRSDHTFSVFVGHFDQHDIARLSLDKCRNVAVPGAANEVTFPMTGYCSILHRCGPFANRNGVFDLSQSITFETGVPGTANRAFGPKMLQKFLLQHATRLYV